MYIVYLYFAGTSCNPAIHNNLRIPASSEREFMYRTELQAYTIQTDDSIANERFVKAVYVN
jgi:hypothetical protein